LTRNEKIESETKNVWKQTKQKYALLISLWSEAKNSKQKEAKKEKKIRVSVQNGSRLALFFEEKNFFCKTGSP
jgi:hypothetical protein